MGKGNELGLEIQTGVCIGCEELGGGWAGRGGKRKLGGTRPLLGKEGATPAHADELRMPLPSFVRSVGEHERLQPPTGLLRSLPRVGLTRSRARLGEAPLAGVGRPVSTREGLVRVEMSEGFGDGVFLATFSPLGLTGVPPLPSSVSVGRRETSEELRGVAVAME